MMRMKRKKNQSLVDRQSPAKNQTDQLTIFYVKSTYSAVFTSV